MLDKPSLYHRETAPACFYGISGVSAWFLPPRVYAAFLRCQSGAVVELEAALLQLEERALHLSGASGYLPLRFPAESFFRLYS